MTPRIERRAFIILLGSAVAAPLPLAPRAGHAQPPAMPVIGLITTQSPEGYTERLRALRRGLKETGFVEGENVAIEYRWAENQPDRLPALAADLVRRRVALIVALGGLASAIAAKAATATIPIVFLTAEDPVRRGLVASLARPGGNLTGINFLSAEVAAKRLELMRELLPKAARVAVLVNPTGPTPEITVRDLQEAARARGMQIQVLEASTSREIDFAFAAVARERPDALFVGTDPFFTSRRVQIAHLASHHSIPAIYAGRQHPEIGGLMSYGSDLEDAIRQGGAYAGRILKGAKPADLPVVQATKFELVINAQTARMLGLAVPPTLLATADEVIE